MRILVAGSLACLGFASTARAETSPSDVGCAGADVVVPPSLPANTPGIPILGTAGLVTASLLAPDGAVVADRVVPEDDTGGRFAVLVIDAALTVGATYTVRWSDWCDGLQTKTFIATEAVPFPAGSGTLTSSAPRLDMYSGDCDDLGRPVLRSLRPLRFGASRALAPFMAIASSDLLVDGEKAFASFGPGQYRDAIHVADIKKVCPQAPSVHTATLRVHIPNGPTILSEPITVEATCPDAPPSPCEERTEEPGVQPEPPNAGESGRAARFGCASAPARTGGIEMLLIALAVTIAAARRPTR